MRHEKFAQKNITELMVEYSHYTPAAQFDIIDEIRTRLEEDNLIEYMRNLIRRFLENPKVPFQEIVQRHPINLYFDRVFCITLDRRPDRRALAEQQFRELGINVEFISGVDGQTLVPVLNKYPQPQEEVLSSDGTKVSKGDIGCTRSHLKVIQLAKERGYENVMVLEDDALCKSEFKNVDNYLLNIPSDWQMIYFGGDNVVLTEPNVPVNQFFYRSLGVNTTHAYAIKCDAFDAAIEALSKHEKVDLTLRTIHANVPTYIATPKLISQRDGFSDILEKETTYPEWIK